MALLAIRLSREQPGFDSRNRTTASARCRSGNPRAARASDRLRAQQGAGHSR